MAHLWPLMFHRLIVCRLCFLWCSRVGHLSRHSANGLDALQRGGLANLNPAVCPSAARSPTCSAKVPRAVVMAASCPSAVSTRSSVRQGCSGHRRGASSHVRWFTAWRCPKAAANLKRCKNQVSNEQSAYRRPAMPLPSGHAHVHQAESRQVKGSAGMPRSNIYPQSKACLFSSAVPSRRCLTGRSSRHPKAPLVGALRASRSGAAYLGR